MKLQRITKNCARTFHSCSALQKAIGFSQIKTQIHAPFGEEETRHKYLVSPNSVSVVGAPIELGQPLQGASTGPTLLREAGLIDMLTSLGWQVHDSPDLPQPAPPLSPPRILPQTFGKAHHCQQLGAFSHTLAQTLANIHEQQKLALVLGGDHSLGFASVAGALRTRPELGVLWVDAHADINTPATSLSGNMHGMPLAIAMGLCDQTPLPGFEWFLEGKEHWPRLDPGRLVYIGLRDVDPGEAKYIRELGIKTFTMTDIDRLGIGRVMEEALGHVEGRPLHVSFDIDSVDPVYAPSTGTVVRGGLSYREAHYVMEAAAATKALVGVDMVEVNAMLNTTPSGSDETVEMGKALIGSALGNKIL